MNVTLPLSKLKKCKDKKSPFFFTDKNLGRFQISYVEEEGMTCQELFGMSEQEETEFLKEIQEAKEKGDWIPWEVLKKEMDSWVLS